MNPNSPADSIFPRPSANGQMELAFEATSVAETGGKSGDEGAALAAWRAERARANEELCRRLGLPVNHRAEVRLAQGIVLRGILRLAEETLWIEANRHSLLLRIDGVTFRVAEIEAAVRLD